MTTKIIDKPFCILLSFLLIMIVSHKAAAATPGLPFTEDFSMNNLIDKAKTTAELSTEEQSVRLAFARKRFGALVDPPVFNISSEQDSTADVAIGDINGDGHLDLVAGNSGVNKFYLNTGLREAPFADAVGVNITDDEDTTIAIALGDMDRDGDLDVIAGNFRSSSQLYLNNGTLNPFENIEGIPFGDDFDNTRSIAVGDVDGDGDLDVIIGNYDDFHNRLYLNNGSENPFENVTSTDILEDSVFIGSLALGDVDGDGDLDLVAGISGDDFGFRNHLYLNNGSENPFENVNAITIDKDADDTRSVALGDMNGDGDLDVIAGNVGSPSRVYLNNGSENPFENVVGLAVSVEHLSSISIAVGDLNADGYLDVITGNFFTNSPNHIYLNNGTQNPFVNVDGINISGDDGTANSIALGDMDGDGDLDVIVGNDKLANRLYLNNSTRNPFENATGLNIGDDSDRTIFIALGDVDGDGDLDVVAGNQSGANRLYLNNGTENPFVNGANISDDLDNTESIVLGDIDGDGDLDVVAGNDSPHTNRLYLNNGSANPFENVKGINITDDRDRTQSITLGDVDGDGDLDVVAGNELGPNRLYLHNGTEDPFANVDGVNLADGRDDTKSIALGDMDGDGDLDVVVGNIFGDNNQLYLNNGTEDPFANVNGIKIAKDSGSKIGLGDVNKDGDLDLVAGNRLYLNNGTEDPFANVNGVNIDEDASSITLADVDKDGDLDAVAGNRLYLNNGTKDPFADATGQSMIDEGISNIAFGDIDGDEDLDVVSGNSGANRLYLNNGSENPFANINGVILGEDDAENITLSLAVGDVNGDGDLDVVTGNSIDTEDGHSFQPNRLYLNNGSENPFANVIGSNITDDEDGTKSIALGDMDGDGDLDVVIGNVLEGSGIGNPSHANRVYLNNGNANPFENVNGNNISDDENDTSSIALGDVDGDGDLDVVVGNILSENRLYLNNGSASPFENVIGLNITDNKDATNSIALGDVDGDGDLDVVVGNSRRAPNRLYLNNGSANPFENVNGLNITDDDHSTFSIALGDMDGDGDLDVVVGNILSENRLYLNNGSADPFRNVTGSNVTDDNDFTLSLALGDIDGDGDLDVVAGNSNDSNHVYRNNGSEDPFANVIGARIAPFPENTQAIAVADLTGDNLPEVITGNIFGPNRVYFLNTNLSEPVKSGLQTHLGSVVSQTIDDRPESNQSATLTAITDVPTNSSIDFYLSNNGGQKWYQVQSGEPFIFPTVGHDLRWRAELHSLSPAVTPALTSVSVTANPVTPEAPEAPSNLSATVLSASSISLEWGDNSDNEMRFRIDRKTGEGSFSELVTVDENITTHSDEGLQADTEYSYRVRAENAAGNSNYSNTATKTTQSDISPFPIVLQGSNLPENVTVELSINKPSETAATARLILEVFDADKLNEGELIINGNDPIQLFGKLRSPDNNGTTATIEITTPADWWQDGINTLEFIHTQSGGYRVESGVVEFDESSADFPLVLQGKEFPEEATVVIAVSKPTEAPETALLNLTVFDADKSNEGELIINGNTPIQLFGNLRSPQNNRMTATIALSTPSAWWQDGDNTLRFIHTQSGGYRVESATVDFGATAKAALASIDSEEAGKEVFMATGNVAKFDETASSTIYEDAEDKTTAGWHKYNKGAVKNVIGGAGGSERAIEIIGDIENDVFRLGTEVGSDWNNDTEFFAEFSIAFEEAGSGAIYFAIETNEGNKHLAYTTGTGSKANELNTIYHDLGDVDDGEWHTIQRNLNEDLQREFPNSDLIEVKSLFVYGSLKLDNIILSNSE